MSQQGVFAYNEATGQTSHDDLGSVISGLEASLSDLGGFVNSVKSNWDGDEMDEYTGIQSQWDGAADTVKAILASVRQVLGSTNSSVGEMRSQVRAALAKH
jgi:uncharacterized protein YukE